MNTRTPFTQAQARDVMTDLLVVSRAGRLIELDERVLAARLAYRQWSHDERWREQRELFSLASTAASITGVSRDVFDRVAPVVVGWEALAARVVHELAQELEGVTASCR